MTEKKLLVLDSNIKTVNNQQKQYLKPFNCEKQMSSVSFKNNVTNYLFPGNLKEFA